MSQSEEHERSGSNASWVAAIIVALIFYILSPIMTFWLDANGMMPRHQGLWKTLYVVFYPLGIAYDNVTPVKQFYDWCQQQTK